MKKTVVILAGGLGSRYKGQKQIDEIFDGKVLMDFSIENALKSGFNKFVFVVNEMFTQDLKDKYLTLFHKDNVECHFVLQDRNKYVPEDLKSKFSTRQKPWGTAHAVLCAKHIVKESFAVINADDYYGFSGFNMLSKLINDEFINDNRYSLIAYQIANTLSQNGGVSRGICIHNGEYLEKVVEEKGIQKTDGKYISDNYSGLNFEFKDDSLISMNFWGLSPSFFNHTESFFIQFLERNPSLKDELYIPFVIDQLIQKKIIKVKINSSEDQWFGLTFPEDKEWVVSEITKLKNNEK